MIIPNPQSTELESSTPYRDEKSFREMEPIWAEALKGSITLDPALAARPITQGTLKTKLMETRVSFEQNHWKSTLIPLGANLRLIKINTLKGGLIQLKNTTADRQATVKQTEVISPDQPSVAIKDGRAINLLGSSPIELVEIDANNREAIVDVMSNPPSDVFSKAYMVHCSSVDETKALIELGESLKSPVQLCGDGWIRLGYL